MDRRTNTTNPATGTTEAPEQLSLPGCPEVPARFRFDRHTRELGLANVAAIKAQLTARANARAEAEAAARTERLQRRSAA